MSETKADNGARYFRAPLETARGIKEQTGDPDCLAAWLVMRRFTFGHKRELTCAGAKKVGSALGISRPRADRLIKSLLALRFGDAGEGIALATADDWRQATGHKIAPMKGHAPVYVSPETGAEFAYLPDLLIPQGDARSPLAELCELDPALGLDALHLLLLAHHAVNCADYMGACPRLFAYEDWTMDADAWGFDWLGHLGDAARTHYWLVAATGRASCTIRGMESLVGEVSEESGGRYWKALDVLRARGFLCRIAIVSDARDRLLYPLHVYGESHQRRLEAIGIPGSIATRLAREADREGQGFNDARFETDGSKVPDLFVVATRSEAPPRVRTVYAPTLIAPTPENVAGLDAVARLSAVWG